MRKFILTTLLAASAVGFIPQAASAEGLLSSVGKTVGEVVEDTTSTVEKVTPDVKVEVADIEVDTSEGVEISTPVAEVSATEEQGLEITAAKEVVEAKVSSKEGIEAKTPVAKVKVTEETKVEISTPIVSTEIEVKDPEVKISTPIISTDIDPVETEVEIETPVVQKPSPDQTEEEVAQTNPATEQVNQTDQQQPVTFTPAISIEEVSLSSQAISLTEEPVKVEIEPFISNELNELPDSSANQNSSAVDIALEKLQQAKSQDFTTGISSSSSLTGLSTPLASSGGNYIATVSDEEFYNYFAKVSFIRHVYALSDQWSHAPPSPPPQVSSFFEMTNTLI